MILCIDIGGTKTELASLTQSGRIKHSLRFPTPGGKTAFLSELTQKINKNFPTSKLSAISIAIPGPVPKGATAPLYLANLPWRDLDIVTPIKNVFKLPTFLGNDAQLAALWETRFARSRAIYITLSTGIGIAVTARGRLDPDFLTYEPGHDLYNSQEWEDLAAASSISKFYGCPVTDITAPEALHDIAQKIAIGLLPVIETTRPKLIVFDGPLGRILPRYRPYLTPLLPKNKIIKLRPARTTHAVIYGCYQNAKKHLR